MDAIRLLLMIFAFKTIVSTCWQLIIGYDYKMLIVKYCLDLSVKLLIKCVEYTADKIMKYWRNDNANLQQQQQQQQGEEDTYGVISESAPIQETNEQ